MVQNFITVNFGYIQYVHVIEKKCLKFLGQ